jgi:hypothetical protein
VFNRDTYIGAFEMESFVITVLVLAVLAVAFFIIRNAGKDGTDVPAPAPSPAPSPAPEGDGGQFPGDIDPINVHLHSVAVESEVAAPKPRKPRAPRKPKAK